MQKLSFLKLKLLLFYKYMRNYYYNYHISCHASENYVKYWVKNRVLRIIYWQKSCQCWVWNNFYRILLLWRGITFKKYRCIPFSSTARAYINFWIEKVLQLLTVHLIRSVWFSVTVFYSWNLKLKWKKNENFLWNYA